MSTKTLILYKRCFVYNSFIGSFDMDENLVSMPFGSGANDREGRQVVEEIRCRFREENELTVSDGVSFSMIFVKFSSDMKKQDSVTTISKENYRNKV